MPAQRGTITFVEVVENYIDEEAAYHVAVAEELARPVITEEGRRRIAEAARRAETKRRPVAGYVSLVDGAMAAIGAIAAAGMVTDWTQRKVREAHRDRAGIQALLADL